METGKERRERYRNGSGWEFFQHFVRHQSEIQESYWILNIRTTIKGIFRHTVAETLQRKILKSILGEQ